MVTVVVGRCGEMRAEREMVPALRCSWCCTWMSELDKALAEAGAPVSHGMCPECAEWNEGQEPSEAA